MLGCCESQGCADTRFECGTPQDPFYPCIDRTGKVARDWTTPFPVRVSAYGPVGEHSWRWIRRHLPTEQGKTSLGRSTVRTELPKSWEQIHVKPGEQT